MHSDKNTNNSEKKEKLFPVLTIDQLKQTLGLTIKSDEINSLVTFYVGLSAFSGNSQLNLSFNAPSSTGKSYIPNEISKLFPTESLIKIGYCSPTAFFHDHVEYDEEKNAYIVDLESKIIIFLDQPHSDLLGRLRPLLSHDEKEIQLKITDKNQKFGLRTKNILVRGFPAVIFCTAGLKIDEQEATRFLLLSPEISQNKIQQSIVETIRKAGNNEVYSKQLELNPERALLKQRILAIKEEKIEEIIIEKDLQLQVEKRFLGNRKILLPRHQRDIKRLLDLAKTISLLSLWNRRKENKTIFVNQSDIEEAFKIWDEISASQELNLPPFIYNIYRDVIIPAYEEKNKGLPIKGFEEASEPKGLTRNEVCDKHFLVYGRSLNPTTLRLEIVPMLETVGLITQEADPDDRRKILISPNIKPKINSGEEVGMDEDQVQVEDIPF